MNMLITSKIMRRRKRDLELYKRRQALLRKPGAMVTAVDIIVAREFEVHPSTIYRIVRRVEEMKKGGVK